MIKKRRFSKQRFDLSGLTNHITDRKDSDASVMFLPDEPRHSCEFKLNISVILVGDTWMSEGVVCSDLRLILSHVHL